MSEHRKRAYGSSLEPQRVVGIDRKGRIKFPEIEPEENVGDNFCQIRSPKGNFTFSLKYSKVSSKRATKWIAPFENFLLSQVNKSLFFIETISQTLN